MMCMICSDFCGSKEETTPNNALGCGLVVSHHSLTESSAFQNTLMFVSNRMFPYRRTLEQKSQCSHPPDESMDTFHRHFCKKSLRTMTNPPKADCTLKTPPADNFNEAFREQYVQRPNKHPRHECSPCGPLNAYVS